MDFAEYQEKAYSTCTPECYTDEYLDLGYLSEVGELAGKLAKRIRGDSVPDDDIKHEIGDVAWMILVKARLYGYNIRVMDSVLELKGIGIQQLVLALVVISHHNNRMKTLMALCEMLGYSFESCLEMNNEKLASRQQRGVIQGNGDNR